MASLDAGPAGAGKVKVQRAKFKGKEGASRRASDHPCVEVHTSATGSVPPIQVEVWHYHPSPTRNG
jgi:hypothetical protein